mgnify:CR=1 FL=1
MKNLTNFVSNELLYYAFSVFGEVIRKFEWFLEMSLLFNRWNAHTSSSTSVENLLVKASLNSPAKGALCTQCASVQKDASS